VYPALELINPILYQIAVFIISVIPVVAAASKPGIDA
jgi:hypothetical protein